MKRLSMMLLLCAAAFSSKAALFINNNSPCPVVLVFYAHDANLTGPCAYYSTRLQVPAGSSMAYNNVTNMNAPGLGWYDPSVGSATLVAAGSAWDAVLIYSTDFAGPQTIGNPGTCATGTTYTPTAASCNFTATWTALGANNVLLEFN